VDLFNLIHEHEIRELRQRLDRLQHEGDAAGRDLMREVAEQTLELRLRLGALVRVLIARGLITAEEYAASVALALKEGGKPASPDDRG
jgi:hypothetical protein